ncbi:hypothetical protein NKH77_12205 [Streptomyces sp. M19]
MAEVFSLAVIASIASVRLYRVLRVRTVPAADDPAWADGTAPDGDLADLAVNGDRGDAVPPPVRDRRDAREGVRAAGTGRAGRTTRSWTWTRCRSGCAWTSNTRSGGRTCGRGRRSCRAGRPIRRGRRRGSPRDPGAAGDTGDARAAGDPEPPEMPETPVGAFPGSSAAPRRRRPGEGARGARVRRSRAELGVWALLGTALALYWLPLTRVTDTGLDAMDGLGLVSVLPPATLAGAALLVAAFASALRLEGQRRALLTVTLLATVVSLHALPAVLESEPRFATAWQHLGFLDYIGRTGEAVPNLDARWSWPGFFAGAEFVAAACGCGTSPRCCAGGPPFCNCCTWHR